MLISGLKLLIKMDPIMIKSKNGKAFRDIILIPTDFSPKCDNAVRQGLELARKLHHKLYILHVIDKQNESILNNSVEGEDCVGLKFLAYRTDFGKESDVVIETGIRNGNIVSEILKVEEELNAGMLIVGTEGKHGMENFFGSHALKLVLHSGCPVVVLQNRLFPDGFKSIVLPVSDAVDPRQAVDWALMLCKVCNAEIRMYLSFERDLALKTRIQIIANQIAAILHEKKVPYSIQTAARSKDFTMQVISYAAATRSDMIMIITRPLGDLMGFGLAGWNEKIMFNQEQIAAMCINPVAIGATDIDWMS